jgi:hypothetical protein
MQKDKIFMKWFETILKTLLCLSMKISIDIVNNVTGAFLWSRITIILECLAFEWIQDV